MSSEIPKHNVLHACSPAVFLALSLALALPTISSTASSRTAFATLSSPVTIFSRRSHTSSLRHRGGEVSLAESRRLAAQQGAAGLNAQIKFADAVEEVLKRKFSDKNSVPRVVKSWRRCVPFTRVFSAFQNDAEPCSRNENASDPFLTISLSEKHPARMVFFTHTGK